MSRYQRTESIPLSSIDYSDTTYQILPFSTNKQNSKLESSINRVGILHPPIVKEKYTDTFQVVSGRRRLEILQKVDYSSNCDCILLTKEINELSVFAIQLEEMLLNQPLSPAEKAFFLDKVLEVTDRQKAAELFLPLMGMDSSPYLIKKLLLLLDLEEPLLISLHKGLLQEKTALELTTLPFKDRWALYEVIDQLQLSVSNQRKFLMSCKDLSSRNQTSIADLLSHQEVTAILNHEETNSPQKTSHLMTWLTEKRFPLLSEAEKNFHQFTAKLKLPGNATLTHSPSFEKDELTFSLRFKNEQDFSENWRHIKKFLAK